jgi:hypothetical protein
LDGTGADYLSNEIKRGVHAAVSHVYLAQRRIGPQDAFQLCFHLLAEEEHLTLALVYAQMLQSIESADEARLLIWAGAFFLPGQVWPDEIPDFLRILVRVQQISHLRLLGASTEVHETELEHLVTTAGTSALDMAAVAQARLQMGVLRTGLTSEEASRGGLEAGRSLRLADARLHSEYPDQYGPPGQVMDLMVGPPEQLFWGGVPKLRSAEEAHAIIKLVGDVLPKERRLLVEAAPGPDLAALLAERCVQLEAEKSAAQRDWNGVLQSLHGLEEAGQAPGCDALRIAAIRARAIAFADHMGRVDDAVAELDLGRNWAQGDDAQVLSYTRARVLHAHRRWLAALKDFQEVISALPLAHYPLLPRDAAEYAAFAAGRLDYGTKLGPQRFRPSATHDSPTPPLWVYIW